MGAFVHLCREHLTLTVSECPLCRLEGLLDGAVLDRAARTRAWWKYLNEALRLQVERSKEREEDLV